MITNWEFTVNTNVVSYILEKVTELNNISINMLI